MDDRKGFFYTDWAALTLNDWIGIVVTVAIFFLMIGAYFYVFHPRNKERLEAQRHIPMDDERDDTERDR